MRAESFLRALGRQLSALSLYGPDHRGLERGLAETSALLAEVGGSGPVTFEISAEGVSADGDPLVGMTSWPWISRFRERGVGQLTFAPDGGAVRFQQAVIALCGELGLEPPEWEAGPHVPVAESEPITRPAAPAGPDAAETAAEPEAAETADEAAELRPAIGGAASEPANDGLAKDVAPAPGGAADMLRELEAGASGSGPAMSVADPPPGRGSERRLDDMGDVLRWVHTEAVRQRTLPRYEVARVAGAIRSLVEAGDAPGAIPIELSPGYTTAHCLNVGLLALAFARRLELEDGAISALAEAALLHDIGRVLVEFDEVPSGAWTPMARSEMMLHPARGARLLLGAGPEHTLAAVVAYEHHMPWAAEGYPGRHFERRTHRFTRMVRICDVYDTLRTPRPFRPAWTRDAAIQLIRSQAGTTFDPELVTAFVGLCAERRVRIPTHDPGSEQGAEHLSLIPEGAFDADLEQAPTLL